MEDSIQIKIRNHTPQFIVGFIVFGVIFCIGLTALLRAFTMTGLIVWLVLWVPLLIWIILSSVRPTVIRCDGSRLHWQHLWAPHTLELYEIQSMRCEPYEVHSRYGTQLRIMLTLELHTQIGDEPETIEFNDSVKAAALLDEKLGGKPTDIPLVQLYQFLRAHTSE